MKALLLAALLASAPLAFLGPVGALTPPAPCIGPVLAVYAYLSLLSDCKTLPAPCAETMAGGANCLPSAQVPNCPYSMAAGAVVVYVAASMCVLGGCFTPLYIGSPLGPVVNPLPGCQRPLAPVCFIAPGPAAGCVPTPAMPPCMRIRYDLYGDSVTVCAPDLGQHTLGPFGPFPTVAEAQQAVEQAPQRIEPTCNSLFGQGCIERVLSETQQRRVVLEPEGDAEDGPVVVSGTGNAACERGYPYEVCAAVSGTGSARCNKGIARYHLVCVAVSGTGDAGSSPPSGARLFAGLSGTGDSYGTAAFSAQGGSSATLLAAAGQGTSTSGVAAATGTGVSRAGYVAIVGGGDASSGALSVAGVGSSDSGYAAVSGAENAHGGVLAVAGHGLAESGAVAVAGTGAAQGGVLGASGLGDAAGLAAASVLGNTTASLVAFSATGDATSCAVPACAAVSLAGDANGGIAVSGTGHASGPLAVSGCDKSLGVACTSTVEQLVPLPPGGGL